MAVTFAKANLRVVQGPLGLSQTLLHGPEGAAQTFVKDDLLQYSSGDLVIAAAADTPELLVGLSTHAASGVTDQAVQFQPFLPGTLIEATLLDAAAADFAFLDANRFEDYGYQGATGAWYLDKTEVTAADTFARIIDTTFFLTTAGLWKKGVAGDTNVRVLALIVHSAWIDA